MRGKVRVRGAAILPLVWLVAAGCAGAGPVRYVYQDGEFGVIGLPENTSKWPTHYRDRAEDLMARHFPRGYEIIRAEEVVEGSRTLTVGGQNTAMIGGSSALDHFFKIGNVGRTSTSTRADTLALKECRILYKKADRPAAVADAKVNAKPPGDAYAAQASLTPAPYLDPNAVVRAQGGPKPVEVKTHSVAKPAPPPEPPAAPEWGDDGASGGPPRPEGGASAPAAKD